jgi:hypothetical protein
MPGCLGGCPLKDMISVMSQLAAVQRLAAAWLSNPPPEAQSLMRAEAPLTLADLMPFADKVGHDDA